MTGYTEFTNTEKNISKADKPLVSVEGAFLKNSEKFTLQNVADKTIAMLQKMNLNEHVNTLNHTGDISDDDITYEELIHRIAGSTFDDAMKDTDANAIKGINTDKVVEKKDMITGIAYELLQTKLGKVDENSEVFKDTVADLANLKFTIELNKLTTLATSKGFDATYINAIKAKATTQPSSETTDVKKLPTVDGKSKPGNQNSNAIKNTDASGATNGGVEGGTTTTQGNDLVKQKLAKEVADKDRKAIEANKENENGAPIYDGIAFNDQLGFNARELAAKNDAGGHGDAEYYQDRDEKGIAKSYLGDGQKLLSSLGIDNQYKDKKKYTRDAIKTIVQASLGKGDIETMSEEERYEGVSSKTKYIDTKELGRDAKKVNRDEFANIISLIVSTGTNNELHSKIGKYNEAGVLVGINKGPENKAIFDKIVTTNKLYGGKTSRIWNILTELPISTIKVLGDIGTGRFDKGQYVNVANTIRLLGKDSPVTAGPDTYISGGETGNLFAFLADSDNDGFHHSIGHAMSEIQIKNHFKMHGDAQEGSNGREIINGPKTSDMITQILKRIRTQSINNIGKGSDSFLFALDSMIAKHQIKDRTNLHDKSNIYTSSGELLAFVKKWPMSKYYMTLALQADAEFSGQVGIDRTEGARQNRAGIEGQENMVERYVTAEHRQIADAVYAGYGESFKNDINRLANQSGFTIDYGGAKKVFDAINIIASDVFLNFTPIVIRDKISQMYTALQGDKTISVLSGFDLAKMKAKKADETITREETEVFIALAMGKTLTPKNIGKMSSINPIVGGDQNGPMLGVVIASEDITPSYSHRKKDGISASYNPDTKQANFFVGISRENLNQSNKNSQAVHDFTNDENVVKFGRGVDAGIYASGGPEGNSAGIGVSLMPTREIDRLATLYQQSEGIAKFFGPLTRIPFFGAKGDPTYKDVKNMMRQALNIKPNDRKFGDAEGVVNQIAGLMEQEDILKGLGEAKLSTTLGEQEKNGGTLLTPAQKNDIMRRLIAQSLSAIIARKGDADIHSLSTNWFKNLLKTIGIGARVGVDTRGNIGRGVGAKLGVAGYAETYVQDADKIAMSKADADNGAGFIDLETQECQDIQTLANKLKKFYVSDYFDVKPASDNKTLEFALNPRGEAYLKKKFAHLGDTYIPTVMDVLHIYANPLTAGHPQASNPENRKETSYAHQNGKLYIGRELLGEKQSQKMRLRPMNVPTATEDLKYLAIGGDDYGVCQEVLPANAQTGFASFGDVSTLRGIESSSETIYTPLTKTEVVGKVDAISLVDKNKKALEAAKADPIKATIKTQVDNAITVDANGKITKIGELTYDAQTSSITIKVVKEGGKYETKVINNGTNTPKGVTIIYGEKGSTTTTMPGSSGTGGTGTGPEVPVGGTGGTDIYKTQPEKIFDKVTGKFDVFPGLQEAHTFVSGFTSAELVAIGNCDSDFKIQYIQLVNELYNHSGTNMTNLNDAKSLLDKILVSDKNNVINPIKNKLKELRTSTTTSDEAKIHLLYGMMHALSTENLLHGPNTRPLKDIFGSRGNSRAAEINNRHGSDLPPSLLGLRDKLTVNKNSMQYGLSEGEGMIGVTAFYRHTHEKDKSVRSHAKEYGLSPCFDAKILSVGGAKAEMAITGAEAATARLFFANNLANYPEAKAIIMASLKAKVGSEYEELITDATLIKYLIDGKCDFTNPNGDKITVAIETTPYFYLSAYCANESIGIRINSVKITVLKKKITPGGPVTPTTPTIPGQPGTPTTTVTDNYEISGDASLAPGETIKTIVCGLDAKGKIMNQDIEQKGVSSQVNVVGGKGFVVQDKDKRTTGGAKSNPGGGPQQTDVLPTPPKSQTGGGIGQGESLPAGGGN